LAWAPNADWRYIPRFIDPSGSAADPHGALVGAEKRLKNSRRRPLLWLSRSGGGKTIADRKVLALASTALRRDVACPTLFRQAKRVNKQRVSQKTIERLIGEGLLRWGNASRTFVVLTERGRALNGD
jgi:hypothetical protein